MRKFLGVFLSMTLAVSMLAGCGGSTGASQTGAAQETEAKEDKAEETAEAEPAGTESAEPTAADAEAKEESQTVASASEGKLQPLAGFNLSGLNGLRPMEEMEDPNELTAEDTDKMDRAMRAYTPPADSLLINKAKNYHYYSEMSRDQQAMYDAMYMCASDPTNPDNVTVANISVDPTSADFAEVLLVSYWGLLYDHPELFWLYNGIEADMSFGAPYQQPGNGTYMVYCYFEEPFDDFEEMMTKFNDAADEFLADIDLTKSEEVVAKDIHDKLINEVTYNTPVMEDTTENGYSNLAHTAYGALVEDNNGTPHYAVCDGYSQAYVYLLQQAGIDAAVIVGVAGNTEADAGGHAWSVVNLGGDWYEVDSTWDDAGTLDEAVNSIKDSDPFSYGYYYEALTDAEYRSKLEHALCYLTTAEITNYVPDDYYNYVTKDQKYVLSLSSSSVHERASENTTGYESYGLLMDLAPVAEGVAFKLR